MEYLDFSSVITTIRKYINDDRTVMDKFLKEEVKIDQLHLMDQVFSSFCDDEEALDFTFDNRQVCRWFNGQARISPRIISFYLDEENRDLLSADIEYNVLPLMYDSAMAVGDAHTLLIQDTTISPEVKNKLTVSYPCQTDRDKADFLAAVLFFGMEREFRKRDVNNKALLAAGSFSPLMRDFIFDVKVPRPCRHFCGRDMELDALHEMLCSQGKVFLQGIAGIGKSELAKAYAKRYSREYTNIIYFTYSGDLKRDIANLDFADDVDDNETMDARFSRHHRLLRRLRDDSLLIIDNFNTVTTRDSLLDVVLNYHCRIIFTTRSKFDNYASVNLEEIADTETLISLMGCFYSDAEKQRPVLEQIIQAVHRHTLAVELSARLLETGILKPLPLLNKLKTEKAALDVTDTIDITKDGSIENDDMPYYLRFLEDTFPYMDKYHDLQEMKLVLNELSTLLKDKSIASASDRALMINFRAYCEKKPDKAIKLQKEAIAMIPEITPDNALLVSNLYSNLGGFYKQSGKLERAKQNMEQAIRILEQYGLTHFHDSIVQITNYAVLLTDMGQPNVGLSALKKLCRVIQEYNSDKTMDYARVQEAMGGICLTIGDIQQATTHFKKAMAIYEVLFEAEPDVIEAKKQELLETYTQSGVYLGKKLLSK